MCKLSFGTGALKNFLWNLRRHFLWDRYERLYRTETHNVAVVFPLWLKANCRLLHTVHPVCYRTVLAESAKLYTIYIILQAFFIFQVRVTWLSPNVCFNFIVTVLGIVYKLWRCIVFTRKFMRFQGNSILLGPCIFHSTQYWHDVWSCAPYRTRKLQEYRIYTDYVPIMCM